MKKILTLFAAFALTLPVLGEFQISSLPFWFFDPDSEIGESLSATSVTYEDGTKLVKNESFRALAVWWDGFSSASTDYIPFELDAQGNPVIIPDAEGAFCMWMETTTFGKINNGEYPTYAPVGDIPGIAGVSNSGAYTFSFSLNKNVVEANLPDSYKKTSYRVYLITQDTRNADGTVAEGAPTSLAKWNAVFVTTCEYNAYYIGKPFALNFVAPDDSYISIDVPSPTLDPYEEEPEPEIKFPEGTLDDVKTVAIKALTAALGKDAAVVTEITNPDVAAEINGIITGRGTVDLDETGTIATFTYDFKVSEITFGESGVTVKVELGENELGEKQSFATGVTVTLVDLEGAALTGVTVAGTKIEESGKNEATVTIQVDSDDIDTLLFKAKAEKVEQTNEEGFEEE